MVEVHDNQTEHRFEILDEGKLAGFARYVRRPGRLILVHTEIDPAFEGLDLGRIGRIEDVKLGEAVDRSKCRLYHFGTEARPAHPEQQDVRKP